MAENDAAVEAAARIIWCDPIQERHLAETAKAIAAWCLAKADEPYGCATFEGACHLRSWLMVQAADLTRPREGREG